MKPQILFAAPHFLFGLFALLLVIGIHLLKRPRTKKLTFSTLRFFDKAAVSSNKSRKIKKLLLFLTRVAIISILSFIFSDPVILDNHHRYLSDPSADWFIFIDKTPSMEYSVQKQSPLLSARTLATLITDNPSCYHTLSFYSEKEKRFIRYSKSSNILNESTPFFDRNSFSKACKEAMTWSRNPVFIILSDFQSLTGRNIDTLLSNLPTTEASFIFCPLTPEKPWNIAIRNVIPVPGIVPMLNVHCRAETDTPVPVTLTVIVDNIRGTPNTQTLPPGMDTILTIPSPPLHPEKTGIVKMISTDPLLFDNSCPFATNTQKPLSILVVGTSAHMYPVISAIKVLPSTWGSRLVTSCTHKEFALKQLFSADIIILNAEQGIRESRALIDQTVRPDKQAFIYIANESYHTGKSTWKSQQDPLFLKLADTSSEMWHGFPTRIIRDVHIYGYMSRLKGIPVAALSNGAPFATRKTDRFKRPYITIGTPLGINSHNNITQTAFLVPFIDRLLNYLELQIHKHQRPWIIGSHIKNPFYGTKQPVPVLDQNGKTRLLLQQQPYFTIDQQGAYKVCPSGQPPYYTFARIHPDESLIDYHVPDTVLSRKNFRAICTPQQISSYCSKKNMSLWNHIPWLILVLLVTAEWLLREKHGVVPS